MNKSILDESAVSEIEQRANAATEGPWADLRDYTPPAIWSRGPTCRFQIPHNNADREFIAHAREDIPALCATVKHLRAEIAEFEQTDLVPRSRYNAADAEAREAREHTKQLAKRAGAEIDSLQSQLEQLRAENERLKSDLREAIEKQF